MRARAMTRLGGTTGVGLNSRAVVPGRVMTVAGVEAIDGRVRDAATTSGETAGPIVPVGRDVRAAVRASHGPRIGAGVPSAIGATVGAAVMRAGAEAIVRMTEIG